MKVSVEVFSSIVDKHFGDEASQYVSDFIKGTRELSTTLGAIGIKTGGDKIQSQTKIHSKPKEHNPTFYDGYGRSIR